MSAPIRTIEDFARHILERGDLAAKLSEPVQTNGQPLVDAPHAPVDILAPNRDSVIQMAGGADKLPRLNQLNDPSARLICLKRFANHELQTIELFAWALLAFPNVPTKLRLAWVNVLADEQRHCSLYLNRIETLGGTFGNEALSNYFWRNLPAIKNAPNPPVAFLCAMGLTLEQANLDFTLMYRQAFAEAGDSASAAVMQKVHDDEINHVKVANHWAKRLTGIDSDLDIYNQYVPFPFAATRAKGRHFDATSRQRAGLSEPFIQSVRTAQKQHRGSQP